MSDIRLSDLSLSRKVMITLFLLVMGAGYLFAVVNVYVSRRYQDGKPGMSIEDVVRSYHGSREMSLLEAKIHGSMSDYLPDPLGRATVLNWIRDGASEKDYPKVEPVFQDHCVVCHSLEGISSFAPLTSYAEIKPLTAMDRGVSILSLIRTTHTHILSMGMMFLILGLAFSFTSVSERVKVIAMALPFLAIMVDMGSWWLTKYVHRLFAYAIVWGGALTGLSFGVLFAVSLYEMWLRRAPVKKT